MSNTTSLKGTWTEAGMAKLSASYSGGPALVLRQVALGDGAGSVPIVSAHQSALVNEVWRGQVNSVTQNPDNPQEVIVDIVLPFNVGDFWVREWGLFDEGGALVALGPHAEFYKPVLASGQAAEIMERIILPVTQAGAINLSIASGALVTQRFVQNQIQQHNADHQAHGEALSSMQAHITAKGNVHDLPLATPENDGLAPKGGQSGQFFGVSDDGQSYGFLPSALYLGKVVFEPIPPAYLPRFGLIAMHDDRYPVDSPIGERLLEIAELDYMQDFLSFCPISTQVKQLAGAPQNRFSALTSNSAPSPYSTWASSETSSNYGAWKAFNGTATNTTDSWLTGTPSGNAELVLSLGATQNLAVMSYEIRNRNDPTSHYPPRWALYVGKNPDRSVDDWVLIDARDNQSATQNQLQIYTIRSPQCMEIGKLKFVFAPGATNTVSIGYINFFTDVWSLQTLNTVNAPNWSAIVPDYIGDGGISPGGVVMPFIRPVSGSREVGSLERDMVRDAQGRITTSHAFAINGAYELFDIYKGQSATTVYGTTNSGIDRGAVFSLSRCLPTGPENTVVNRGITPCMYVGV